MVDVIIGNRALSSIYKLESNASRGVTALNAILGTDL